MLPAMASIHPVPGEVVELKITVRNKERFLNNLDDDDSVISFEVSGTRARKTKQSESDCSTDKIVALFKKLNPV